VANICRPAPFPVQLLEWAIHQMLWRKMKLNLQKQCTSLYSTKYNLYWSQSYPQLLQGKASKCMCNSVIACFCIIQAHSSWDVQLPYDIQNKLVFQTVLYGLGPIFHMVGQVTIWVQAPLWGPSEWGQGDFWSMPHLDWLSRWCKLQASIKTGGLVQIKLKYRHYLHFSLNFAHTICKHCRYIFLSFHKSQGC